ncbi:MAG: hypothetical protein HPY90_15045 [Syntrophothermus sp.]|uniref:hypothetical protein n=1 Tax=Syntrophothermus sp. TaxID=2736299 RepID=UPI00257B4D15|nr:hypothetical protein [Syntrophothermus sp.]NSW84521.1 hypothetical protein [Syntrophothermus sp.]
MREKFTTTLDPALLQLAREKAAADGLPGINVIIEKALRMYFANCSVEVWEKPLQGGWLKKLTIRQDRVIMENIRSRHIRKRTQSKYYTPDFLESKGWKQTWKLKKEA